MNGLQHILRTWERHLLYMLKGMFKHLLQVFKTHTEKTGLYTTETQLQIIWNIYSLTCRRQIHNCPINWCRQLPNQLVPYVLCYWSLRQINHKCMKEKHAEFQLMKTQFFWCIIPSRWTHGLLDAINGWSTFIRKDANPSTRYKVPENFNTPRITWRL
jgi:hypothetical protein